MFTSPQCPSSNTDTSAENSISQIIFSNKIRKSDTITRKNGTKLFYVCNSTGDGLLIPSHHFSPLSFQVSFNKQKMYSRVEKINQWKVKLAEFLLVLPELLIELVYYDWIFFQAKKVLKLVGCNFPFGNTFLCSLRSFAWPFLLGNSWLCSVQGFA